VIYFPVRSLTCADTLTVLSGSRSRKKAVKALQMSGAPTLSKSLVAPSHTLSPSALHLVTTSFVTKSLRCTPRTSTLVPSSTLAAISSRLLVVEAQSPLVLFLSPALTRPLTLVSLTMLTRVCLPPASSACLSRVFTDFLYSYDLHYPRS
jgi:hypothetical protein